MSMRLTVFSKQRFCPFCLFKSLFTVEQLAEVRGGVNCKRVSYNPLTYMVSDLVETTEERKQTNKKCDKIEL